MAERDIAIIGMSCLFPGASDLATYWQNIVSKVDAITEPPPEAWDADIFYDPASTANDRVYCKRGGFLGALASFNPLEHGVMPLTVQGSEPDQWLALRVAREALTDAGYGEEIPERHRTAVIVGKGTYLNHGNFNVVQHGTVVDQTLQVLRTLHPEYSQADLQALREELKRHLPPFNADTVPGLIPNVTVGRIANRFDFMGPSYTVDAACASSLVAIDMAVRELLTHQCDLALVGGVHVVTPVPVLMVFCHLNALSRQERIRPFDNNADGTILGEGLGMIVLKRRQDAEQDGHRIYAVIKGTGIASDGRGVSVMAPRLDGEILALQRAYEAAAIPPRTVGLIEAHGTGTPVGDATELKALTQVFGVRHGALPSCALGSIKSMIGHLMPAAGIAGIIKAALALYHQVRPPTLHVDTPTAQLTSEQVPFYLNTETRPWIQDVSRLPRRAGVNAFGFGGINAHVILEESAAPDSQAQPRYHWHWDTEVCILSAASQSELIQRGRQLQQFLQARPQVRLKDLAYTLNIPLHTGPARVAIVASSLDDLQSKLDRVLPRLADPQCHRIRDSQGIYYVEPSQRLAGRLAFLYPGEGSQYVNMLADLCLHFPEVREKFDLLDGLYAERPRHYTPSDILFPPPTLSETERLAVSEQLWHMEEAVGAVLTANQALFDLLGRLEIHPDVMVGHSAGDYSAMFASGMINVSDHVRVGQFARELGQIQQVALRDGQIPPAALLVAGTSVETVLQLTEQINGDVHIAMDNCPHQTVIVAAEQVAEQLGEQLRRGGVLCERLPFNRPYHTPLFSTFAEKLQPFLARWLVSPPHLQTYSCLTQAPFPTDVRQMQRMAMEHWRRPVAFRPTIEAMYDDNVRCFVEVGPRGNLTAFVDDILRHRPHLAVPANVMHRSGITQLNHLVGILAAQGIPLCPDYLYARRSPRRLQLDRPEHPLNTDRKPGSSMMLATGWPSMHLAEETATRLRARMSTMPAVSAPSDLPAQPQAPSTVPPGHQPTSSSSGQAWSDARAQVMSANLQTMERFLAVQHEVMKAFLSGQQATVDPASIPVPSSTLPLASASPTVTASPQTLSGETEAHPSVVTWSPPESTGGNQTVPVSPPGVESATDLLLQLISERTGYPTAMLDLHLDLEADLGIDSIKRIEILGLFQQHTGLLQGDDLEGLSNRKTLQEVVHFLHQRVEDMAGPISRTAVASPSVPLLPFIGTVVAHNPGQELVVRRHIDREEDLFLQDHTLGRQISSTDPTLRGLPVMPLTMSVEMLAEAAAVLVPGQVLVAMRHIRAYRWLTLEERTCSVELVARRKSLVSGNEIDVQLYEAAPTGTARSSATGPIVEGTMVFSDTYPEPPHLPAFTLHEEHDSQWIPTQLYSEVMFHGPAFRGTVAINHCGSDGIETTIQALAADGLFRSNPQPALITDPVLLDQPGQAVGFWTAEHLRTGYVIFPFRLETLQFYGPQPQVGEQFTCRARIHLLGEHQVRSDLDLVQRDGRVWARFGGWEDRRFPMPDVFFRFMLAPADVMLSELWLTAMTRLQEAAALHVCRLDLHAFPAGFLTASGGIWQRVLAFLVLNERERQVWHDLEPSETQRSAWLLERLVAKDGVRRYLQQAHGAVVCPADIDIGLDAHGCPIATGQWATDIPNLPLLCLAQTDGMAIAIVGDTQALAGLGVDIEPVSDLRTDGEAVLLSADEQLWLSTVPATAQSSWLARLQCAKRAAVKALGPTFVGGPQALVVEKLEPATETLYVGLSAESERRFPTRHGQSLVVYTIQDNDRIVATALWHRR